ncbi:hypothetical protein Tco_0865130 [Tanacetum coccineum]
MCTYLKNMGRYKHNQLKGRSYEEIQKIFDKAYKQVSSFVPMDSEVVKSSVTRTKESSKRTGDEVESDKSKKQKIDEHVEAKNDDQEEAGMKRHIEVVKDNEVAIDAIPLSTKPIMIVEYKIDKDGRMGYFKLIRADGSLKRYSSMIKMLQDIDREDLETLWKLIKARHENTGPKEDYERVLWGDLSFSTAGSVKKMTLYQEKSQAVAIEVEEWVKQGIVRLVRYPPWISNPILVKKSDGTWRMCIDFKNINAACPKVYYPVPKIDLKIKAVMGFWYKSFLDAYKGYHQVQMAEEDEEKMAFYSD